MQTGHVQTIVVLSRTKILVNRKPVYVQDAREYRNYYGLTSTAELEFRISKTKIDKLWRSCVLLKNGEYIYGVNILGNNKKSIRFILVGDYSKVLSLTTIKNKIKPYILNAPSIETPRYRIE